MRLLAALSVGACLLQLTGSQIATVISVVLVTSTVCPCVSTSSSSAASSSSYIPDSNVGSSSTSNRVTTVAATTASPSPESTPFPIRIETTNNQPLRKREYYYLGFQNDTAVTVSDLASASLFQNFAGYLSSMPDGQYVGVDTSRAYQVLKKYTD